MAGVVAVNKRLGNCSSVDLANAHLDAHNPFAVHGPAVKPAQPGPFRLRSIHALENRGDFFSHAHDANRIAGRMRLANQGDILLIPSSRGTLLASPRRCGPG